MTAADNISHKQWHFRRTFLTGLVFILPIIVSIWLVRFVFDAVSTTVTPLTVQFWRLVFGISAESYLVRYAAPLFSVTFAIFLIWLIGLIGGNVIGRRLLRRLEAFMLQVPIVKGIYKATRQFLDTFSSAGSKAFKEVVLIEYPRKGVWSMAFVTNDDTGREVQEKTATQVISVFIPTTPNPTSGWLIFLPRSECQTLEMTVDEAFKMIISGGVLTPDAAPSPLSIDTTDSDTAA